MGTLGRDFLKVILICLLSPCSICAQEPGLADVAVQSPLKTPEVRKPLGRLENSAKRPRIQHKKSSEHEGPGTSEQKANPRSRPSPPSSSAVFATASLFTRRSELHRTRTRTGPGGTSAPWISPPELEPADPSWTKPYLARAQAKMKSHSNSRTATFV